MMFPIARRKYEPFLPELSFAGVLEDFLKYPFKLGLGREWMPALDVYEKDGKAVADIELPGVDPKDVKLSIDGNILTVSGEKKEEREGKKDGYYRLESSCGRFERSVELPFDVKADKASATYKKGVLKVEIPKSEVQRKKDIKIDIN